MRRFPVFRIYVRSAIKCKNLVSPQFRLASGTRRGEEGNMWLRTCLLFSLSPPAGPPFVCAKSVAGHIWSHIFNHFWGQNIVLTHSNEFMQIFTKEKCDQMWPETFSHHLTTDNKTDPIPSKNIMCKDVVTFCHSRNIFLPISLWRVSLPGFENPEVTHTYSP